MKTNICFNFKTKKECKPKDILKALKGVDTIISPYMKLDAKPSECKVIEYFDDKNLFIAYPAKALAETSIIDAKECHKGKCQWRGRISVKGLSRSFSLKDNVLYIGFY